MLQIGSLQHSGELRIIGGYESAAVLAPGALGEPDPILRCELRELSL